MTGVLLAIARISGETAPLLFTALNNQFWSLDLNAPMASLPVVIYQFALSPYEDWQKLAWAGALIITVTVLALNIAARALAARENSHECRSVAVPTVTHAADRSRDAARQGLDRATWISSTATPGAEEHQPDALREQGDRVHRPVGLRQVHAAARAQPHVRPLSRPARDRRGPARRREHPLAQAGSQPAARAHRHGVPEADAVPDVDLREHRASASGSTSACRSRSSTGASRMRCAAPRCGTR